MCHSVYRSVTFYAFNFFSFQAVDCGPLEEPINGTKIGEKTTFKSIIQFGCDDGFDLLGAASRTCQANKQWTGRKTICSGNCCLNPLPNLK